MESQSAQPAQSSVPPVTCTLSYFGKEYRPQVWYNCWTCSQSPGTGVCYACAHICHKGHKIGSNSETFGFDQNNLSGFFCDCGDGAFASKCQCFQVIKKAGEINSVELSNTKVDFDMVKSTYATSQCSIISPMNIKMALELGGEVFGCSDLTMPFIKSKYTEVPSECLLIGCGVFGTSSANTKGVSFDCTVTEKSGQALINAYVSEKTKGMIPELLTQEPMGTTIVSTLYFKGEWVEPFKEFQTSNNWEFKGVNGTANITVMRKFGDKKNTKFIRTDTLKSLVLPYVGDRFVAVMTLPKNYKESLNKVFNSPGFYDEWNGHLQLNNVETLRIQHFVPKFSKRFRYSNMEQILKGAGFDFDAFRSKSGIDQIIHEVVIEMDEVGTKASAATSLVSKGIPDTDDSWIGDQPYMLAIVDTTNRSVVFAGVMDFTV